ncbi:hypothetical protein RGU70_14050 [Herbaspirillum sp. RTI4]|uniref:hypothetical protein n=1 Tax=Herbaspirillum sp. RTI4 TaxID=3048640 RepID=UPI002AB56DD8|nr:hypothetical protein [Herbaspirillum sp. RTI4]MDY7579437.1 hypothetical protein [Herbaspirillum sp. RTI4]MEA9980351.1 hypothetical protein [Herbaspirillum sp. RTI4]
MSERDISLAALRWHDARIRRLDMARHKPGIDYNAPLWIYREQIKAGERLKEAKRQERAALRVLAKACEAQRGRQIDDALIIQCV